MTNRYLERAGLSCDSPLFCQLSKTKCGYKPRTKGLSYSRLRELVLEAFKDILPRGGSRISKGGVDGRPYLLKGGRENALTKKIGNNFTCTCLRRVF